MDGLGSNQNGWVVVNVCARPWFFQWTIYPQVQYLYFRLEAHCTESAVRIESLLHGAMLRVRTKSSQVHTRGVLFAMHLSKSWCEAASDTWPDIEDAEFTARENSSLQLRMVSL